MTVLRDELSHSPVDAEPERTIRIRSSWEELERRGHPVDGYVRWGLERFIATSIVIATILPDLEAAPDGSEPVAFSGNLREAPPGWTDLLDWVHTSDPTIDKACASLPDDERVKMVRVIGALIGPFAELTNSWVKTANREDLIAWRPPSNPEEVRALASIDTVPKDKQATYRWLMDRFTLTYLTDWAKESLYLEWRYLHAELLAPCPSKEIGQRRIAEPDVSKAIASRVAPAQRDQQPGEVEGEFRQAPGLSIGQLTVAAIEFLEAGRRAAAAALFEAARRENPNDPDVRNNYGFCILPEDPEAGLQEIHAAGELGYAGMDITLANRVYGLFRLGRFASALEVAGRLFREEDVGQQAYLWDWRKGPDNATVINVNTRQYAVQLALDIAREAGDISQISLWASRAESLGLAPEA